MCTISVLGLTIICMLMALLIDRTYPTQNESITCCRIGYGKRIRIISLYHHPASDGNHLTRILFELFRRTINTDIRRRRRHDFKSRHINLTVIIFSVQTSDVYFNIFITTFTTLDNVDEEKVTESRAKLMTSMKFRKEKYHNNFIVTTVS